MLQINTPFPAFSLPDQTGDIHTLARYATRWCIFYFYPRDNTPGCSLEAAGFAKLFAQKAFGDAALLGVSADSPASHAKFAEKLCLPFPLLSDPEHTLLEAVGVWQQKKMAGREYMGIVRSTYLVDPAGKVRAVWTKVKPEGHPEAVLEKLRTERQLP